MMAPFNPNALSNGSYWALVNGQSAPNTSQGIGAISGGAANWGTAPYGWLTRMAADIASRGGLAVQQNGYDATAAVPVAAGPAWAGASPIPAYPRSGAHMTMTGSREAWQRWGIPPVLMQQSPYATAAYRTYTDPYGQLGVQPLIGFPSAYPHVLSGVPNSPFRVQGFINALLPQAGFMPFMGMPQMPMPAQPKAQGIAAGRGVSGANAVQKNTTQPAAKAQPQPVAQSVAPTPSRVRGYDETKWRNLAMPVPPAPSVMPVMTQLTPELGGNVNTSPEAHAAGHAVTYEPYFKISPNGTAAMPSSSFVPNLLTPEEAAETAGGMYIDPDKTLMQNLVEGLGAVSLPLAAGAGPLLYSSAPRIAGGGVVPPTAPPIGALP